MTKRPDSTPTHVSVPRRADTYDPFPVGQDGLREEWIESLRIWPLTALEWHWPKGFSVGPRVLNDSMWLCLLSGEARGWVGSADRTMSLGAGDVMLVATGQEHYLENCSRRDLDLVAVHFHANVFGAIDLLSLAGFPAVAVASANSPHLKMSRELAREYALRAPGWKRALESGLAQVLIHVMRTTACLPPPLPHSASHRTLVKLYPAMEYLERNLGDADLSVGELAGRVHLSDVQFRKLFKRVTGATPVSFMRTRRIQLACSLLRQTDREIKQVAEECGFADALFFFKVFKAVTGTTPAVYRDAEEP